MLEATIHIFLDIYFRLLKRGIIDLLNNLRYFDLCLSIALEDRLSDTKDLNEKLGCFPHLWSVNICDKTH